MMPPVSERADEVEQEAFTVLNHDGEQRDDITVVVEFSVPPGKSVNVVKPLQRREEDGRNHLNSAKREVEMTAPAVGPQTILDPKFSRALDFKLRRLKEKEAIQQNLRRPSRFRPKNGPTAASDSNLNRGESPTKRMSRSQPHIVLPEECDEKVSPKMDSSPSPNRRSKRNASFMNDPGEKPRFVTTVKTGRFLLPPPEVASLLGLHNLYPPEERQIYFYSSKPKAVPSRSKEPSEQESKVKPGLKEQKRLCANNAFGGVRSLIAGIVGMRSHMNQRDQHKGEGELDGSNENIAPYSNMMHERRVVRGSTYAHPPQGSGAGDAETAAARAARTRRRALAKRAAAARLRPGTPPPAPGRKHHPIQTEYYLEELFDKGVEMEIGVQTDLFLDRPATPLYVPAKTGMDASTQIYPGELFDFDIEVQPIVEVLVGKTTEQALSEVAQEEELATLREQQQRFLELRDAERAERQRLAEQDRRLEAEKERRLAEARAARVTAVESKERAAAATLVQGYLADLLPSVLANLRDQGYLQERTEYSVEEDFLPWLTEAVSVEVESIITSRDVITEIVREVVELRAERYRAAGELAAEQAAIPPPSESSTEPSAPSEFGAEEMELNEE